MAKEPHHKHFTRGGQIAFHNLRMFFQINKALFNVHCVGWLIFFVATVYYLLPIEVIQQTLAYYGAQIFKVLKKEHVFMLTFSGKPYHQTVVQILHYPYYAITAETCLQKLLQCLWVSFGASISLAVLIAIYFIKKGKFQTENQLIRGTQLVDASILKGSCAITTKSVNSELSHFPKMLL